jgi:hypothetical protein
MTEYIITEEELDHFLDDPIKDNIRSRPYQNQNKDDPCIECIHIKKELQQEREKLLDEIWCAGVIYDEILKRDVIHHSLLFEKLKELRGEQ